MTERDNASHRFYANAKPEVTEAERAAERYVRSKTPILPGTMDQFTWQQWDDIIREREKNAFLAGHANGEAEGRRREREQIQKEILPEWAEKRLQQREEAAARSMATMILDDCPPFRDPKLIPATVDIYMRDWKQRKSQGGVGV